MTCQNCIFESGKKWEELRSTLLLVLFFSHLQQMKQRSTSFVQLDVHLGAGGSHKNEKSCKYSASGETQRLNAMLEM